MTMNISKNMRAFLDMIAVSEGTSTSPATMNNGYDVIVTGADRTPEIFIDYRAHPFANGRKSKVINSKGLTSNASGRYQFMGVYWPHYKLLLDLPDFGPASQDKWAIHLIKECKATADVEAGRFADAVHKCRSRWASFPGAGYNQHENSLVKLQRAYVAAGGVLA